MGDRESGACHRLAGAPGWAGGVNGAGGRGETATATIATASMTRLAAWLSLPVRW